jgi:hypothetical protein
MTYIVLTRRFVERPQSQQWHPALRHMNVRMSLLCVNEEFQPLLKVNKAK